MRTNELQYIWITIIFLYKKISFSPVLFPVIDILDQLLVRYLSLLSFLAIYPSLSTHIIFLRLGTHAYTEDHSAQLAENAFPFDLDAQISYLQIDDQGLFHQKISLVLLMLYMYLS
jgi:hypothetical protein